MKHNPNPQMTFRLSEEGVFRDDPFSLVDIGASGGIEPHWRAFRDSLQAVGFDPLVDEIARLNSIERSPAIKYIASRVGCRAEVPEWRDHFNNEFYPRTSAARALELKQCDYVKSYIDQTHEGTVSSDLIELDEFFRDRPEKLDFIKIDTDGQDFQVLLGAGELLSRVGPIGLTVEALFVGQSYPHLNLFSHVDNLLRSRGYSLFAIDPVLYSRAALPRQFCGPKPINTTQGQLRWANTLFFRDVCLPGYEQTFKIILTPHKLLKLCCAFEMYGLEDCAAEVLIQFRERIQHLTDVDRCLNLLTPPLPNNMKVSYREYVSFFDTNVDAFYSGV